MNEYAYQNIVVRSDFPGNKVQNGKSKETNAHLNMIRHLGRVYFASVRLELLFLERKNFFPTSEISTYSLRYVHD